MNTYTCDINPNEDKRKKPRLQSSVYMEGNWSFHAYKRSHDKKNNIVHRADGFDVYKNGRSVRYKYTFHGAERGSDTSSLPVRHLRKRRDEPGLRVRPDY